MTILKIGHCCLLIEVDGLRILTDPGMFSTGQNTLSSIDAVLITHEHQDHLHMDSLKEVLRNNPKAVVITNTAVGKLLEAERIAFSVVEHGQNTSVEKVIIEGFGEIHAPIYPTIPTVQNTGYFVANRLFYPGDAFVNPQRAVEILALPVVAPWMNIAEAIDFAKALKPAKVFPVHDGFLKIPGPFYMMPKMLLEPTGISFITPEENVPMQF